MSITSESLRLGRLHRTYNPRIPHMSALLAGQKLLPPPPSVDYTSGMPGNLGVMRNDSLGDCTCAAYFHARQVWTFNAEQHMVTEPDSDVVKLYVLACGYIPEFLAKDRAEMSRTFLRTSSSMVHRPVPRVHRGTKSPLSWRSIRVTSTTSNVPSTNAGLRILASTFRQA